MFSVLSNIEADSLAKFTWILLSTAFFITISLVLFKIHKNPKYSNFNLIDLFIDSDTNKVSSSKFMLIIAFAITTWSMIQISIFDHMNPEFMTIYIGAFVFNNLTNRYINKTSPISGPEPLDQEKNREKDK